MPNNSADRLDVMVSTRFGVGVTDQAWLEHRFLLLEAITAPSLRNQTYSNFVWNIFVGEQAESWVVERLRLATSGIGKQVLIHKTAQNYKTLQKYAENMPGDASHTLLLLIDDDDAWNVGYMEACVQKALGYVDEGRDKVAFSFSNGLEWLVTDLVDVDVLLNKGKKIVRQSAAYFYYRPFHSMAIGVLSPGKQVPERFGRVHGTMGESLAEAGYQLDELTMPEPAWLYVRHRQADSAIRKAHNAAPVSLSLDQLEAKFGVSANKLESYQNHAKDFGYARKRIHKEADKYDLCISVEEDRDFRKEDLRNESGLIRVVAEEEGVRFYFIDESVLRDRKVRVIAYDIQRREYVFKKVYETGFSGLVEYGGLGFSNNIKFKVQFFDEGSNKWRDSSPYIKVSDC